MQKTTQETINGIVWKACDTFRTTMDSSQYKDYILTKSNADEYHRLHWILLYFIYLVFLVSQTIEKTEQTKKELLWVKNSWIYEWQVGLMKERLNYVDELNRDTFERYKRRLELFFKMF